MRQFEKPATWNLYIIVGSISMVRMAVTPLLNIMRILGLLYIKAQFKKGIIEHIGKKKLQKQYIYWFRIEYLVQFTLFFFVLLFIILVPFSSVRLSKELNSSTLTWHKET